MIKKETQIPIFFLLAQWHCERYSQHCIHVHTLPFCTSSVTVLRVTRLMRFEWFSSKYERDKRLFLGGKWDKKQNQHTNMRITKKVAKQESTFVWTGWSGLCDRDRTICWHRTARILPLLYYALALHFGK